MTKFSVGFGLLILLWGCLSPQEIYVCDVDDGGWSRNDTRYLFLNNRDTSLQRDLYLIIRHQSNYPYTSLNLVIETLSPELRLWRDTVSVSVVQGDDFRGRRVSQGYDEEELYRSRVLFHRLGIYRFGIRQLMPDSVLRGVLGVGIRVE